jgi:hypothetical protein
MKMSSILRLTLVASACWAMAGAGGCSDGGGTAAGSGGTGGVALVDAGTPGGAAGGSGGTTAPLGSGGVNPIDGGLDTGTAYDVGTGSDAAGWPNVGVCAERGEATVDASTFDGWEERYIISDSGFGSDAERPCVVRFALKRVGDAPHASTCMDTLAKKCEWTHLVEYSSPQVLADAAGACANSALALSSDAIANIAGSRAEVGFAKQYAGAHGSARLKYFEATQAWDVAGNASWDSTTHRLTYTFRNGLCGY